MAIDIQHIILHQLVKQSDDQLEMVLRETALTNNQATEALVDELHRIYSGKSKAFGIFKEESLFNEQLNDYQEANTDFVSFSHHAMALLKSELIKYPFAEGGVVLFCQYRYLATDYLFIAVLTSCESMLVNDELDVSTTRYLDIERADIVARIDLTELKTNPGSLRYLTFLRGRVGRKVSDFFMDFLGAQEGLNAKVQNKTLVQALDDYCAEIQLDKEETQSYRQQVYSYCDSQLKSGEEIAVEALSHEITPAGDKSFQSFTQEGNYGLEDAFPADRSMLRQLKKFSGSGGGVTINFDAALLGERIFWDPQSDTLTLKGLPPNLRDQLQRRGSNNDE